MFSIPEQFSAVTKSQFEANFAIMTALTNKAFESVEKVVDLNLNVVRASLEESNTAARQLLTAKDPQEFFSLSAAQAKPNAEKALAYGRHLASIASGTQAEFSKAAEAQFAETNRKVIALIDEIGKNAPAGSENAISLMKSAISGANAGYEQFSKTTKQAVEAMENNLNSAVGQYAQAAEKTAARAK